MPDIKIIGLFGLIGLLGLISIWYPTPSRQPGGAVRALGLLGLLGLAGFWNPWLGACGGFGAFGLWNNPRRSLRRLAWAGLSGPVGLATGLLIKAMPVS